MLYDNMTLLTDWASSECCMRLHAGLSAMADPMGPTADGFDTADGFEFPDGPDDEPDEDEDEDEDEDKSSEGTQSISSEGWSICIQCIGSPCVKCARGSQRPRVCIVCVGCGCDVDRCVCGFA
jgi:hypothetical protein